MSVQLVFSLSIAIAHLGGQRVLPRRRQPRAPRAAVVVLPVARALPGRDRQVELDQGATRSSADIFALNPWTVLFGAYRDLLFDGTAPHWSALGILLLVSLGHASRSRSYCSSGPSRRSPRCCDEMAADPMNQPAEERVVIRADRLGVKYSLHLTRKQTVRDTICAACAARGRPRLLGAARRVVQRSCRASRSASSGPTAPARARCSRCWPGSSSRPRAWSRSTATSRAC